MWHVDDLLSILKAQGLHMRWILETCYIWNAANGLGSASHCRWLPLMQQTSDIWSFNQVEAATSFIFIALKHVKWRFASWLLFFYVFALVVVVFKNVDRWGEHNTPHAEDDNNTCTDGATKLRTLNCLIKRISCLNLKTFFTATIFNHNTGILYIWLITWSHEQTESRT